MAERETSDPKHSHVFWQIMVVVGAVVAVASLIDLKYILMGIAVLWIATAAFSLHRIRRMHDG